jgi:hypothetical protein
VSENWPLAEINRFLIFSAQKPFRTTFSRLGILGSGFWASGNGFLICYDWETGQCSSKKG